MFTFHLRCISHTSMSAIQHPFLTFLQPYPYKKKVPYPFPSIDLRKAFNFLAIGVLRDGLYKTGRRANRRTKQISNMWISGAPSQYFKRLESEGVNVDEETSYSDTCVKYVKTHIVVFDDTHAFARYKFYSVTTHPKIKIGLSNMKGDLLDKSASSRRKKTTHALAL